MTDAAPVDRAGAPPETDVVDKGKYLALAAMVFAVSMTFIDQTIVAIAIPEIQKDLGLSSTGLQWVINAYLLSLAALFAFGGRLGDIVGHKKMVVLGVIIFATASAFNGFTPTGDLAEPWIIFFRVVQGAGAAIMFPAALSIVINSFPLRERGKATAIFFAITGAMTAIGPLLGGYLSEWTWRSIFWINVPVAIIALILTSRAHPADDYRKEPLDYRGLVLITAGMGLSVLGLQQSTQWGWSNPATIGTIVAGFVLLVIFVLLERGVEYPLIRVQIFANRAFAVENAVLFFAMICFVPMFFFASMYAQLSLGWAVSEAGLYLLIFFGGFAAAAQLGGRLFDKVGAKVPVALGCALGTAGFALWGWKMTDLDAGAQTPYIILAGAGIGFMLGPASTDAVNRASRVARGEATGITQTIRNYGSALGMAILGSLLIAQNRSNIESTLASEGLSTSEADKIADAINHGGSGDAASFGAHAGAEAQKIFADIQLDFAESVQVVFYAMAACMAVALVIAVVFLRAGRQEEEVEAAT
jgi:EmrB/QacA subfamily drug resistance transporter